MTTIELYFNCLDRIEEEEYIVNEDKIPQEHQQLIRNLQLHHVLLVIHYLLNHQEIGRKTSVRLFLHSEIDPEFLKYVKKSLNNLTIS